MSHMVGGKYHDAPEAVHPAGADYPEVVNFKSLDAVAPKVMEVSVGPRRLGDMKASTFWMILCIICALVIGATIGGAVGGSMAARNKNQAASSSNPSPTQPSSVSSSSSSHSSTSSAATTSPTIEPTSDCQNGTTYDSLFKSGSNGAVPSGAGLTFTRLCAMGEDVDNIASGYFYTFEDCIELCAGLNFWFGDRRCLGVTYQAIGHRPVNCWAHNQTAVVPATDTPTDTAILADE